MNEVTSKNSGSIRLKKNQIPKQYLAVFPDYKGRKFTVSFADKYYMKNYWDGGTRAYCKAILPTGAIIDPTALTEDPFKKEAHVMIEIPDDVCIVEHMFFQGQDIGISFIFNTKSRSGIGFDFSVGLLK